ncbi:MAG: YcnI family protein [Propionibacteriales bacterium]|nr:YcnI family protein [Propionibacteriales bacterium]
MSVRRTFARSFALPAAVGATVVGVTVLAAGPALAHVGISPTEGAAGSYAVATLSVPHGCDGSATTSITIKIPSELNAVTPTRNALWDVKKNVVTLDTPLTDAHGNAVTERVDTVVYTAKSPLPDGYRDAFELSFQVPDAVGKTLVFPTLQRCVKGETNWNQVVEEGAEEPEYPAPSFTVVEGSGDGHGDSSPAAEGEHAAEGSVAESAHESDGASKGLAYTGLGVGVVGLLTAAAALAKSRKA